MVHIARGLELVARVLRPDAIWLKSGLESNKGEFEWSTMCILPKKIPNHIANLTTVLLFMLFFQFRTTKDTSRFVVTELTMPRSMVFVWHTSHF